MREELAFRESGKLRRYAWDYDENYDNSSYSDDYSDDDDDGDTYDDDEDEDDHGGHSPPYNGEDEERSDGSGDSDDQFEDEPGDELASESNTSKQDPGEHSHSGSDELVALLFLPPSSLLHILQLLCSESSVSSSSTSACPLSVY